MSDKFQCHLQDHGDSLIVSFVGTIDEDVDFEAIQLPLKSSYVFNFDAVKSINSCGIREWVKFSERIDAKATFVYQNCTQMIIEQINMVAGFFRAGSKVMQFYAPYFCAHCDAERKILLSASQVQGNEAPAIKCVTCQADLEFDALEEQYFRFLKMTA